MMNIIKGIKISNSSIAVSIIIIVIVTWGWKLLNWVWFKPKKNERYLRQQGLQGKTYRFLKGDMAEMADMASQARSSPFDFSHEVALRASPFLLHLIKTYGKNSFTWYGPTAAVNIMKPEDVKVVLTKSNEFKTLYPSPLAKLLAPGIASHTGEKWAKHRKIVNPAFHQEKLKLMLPQFHESCKEMIEKWEKLNSTEASFELDVWPYLQNLTCDVISRAAFGSNYKEGKLIFDLIKQLAPLVMQALTSFNANIPGWRFLPTKNNKKIKEIDRQIQDSLWNIINKRETAVKGGDESTTNDLLGLLIESNLKEIDEGGGKKSVGLTMEEVMDECRLFYFAGQESTSILLVWTMILLSKYPHWQSLAREEVFHVFGNKKPEYDELNRLKVVTMILYEVLRLYPPAIMLNKTVVNGIRIGNLKLPAGVLVSLPMILIHQDPEIWGEDASEFKPERFSEGISKATKNQVSFFPFGYGPRTCIGQNFALLEAKMAMALILQRFSFDLSPSYIHAPCTVAMLQPEFGAPLILQKLKL